MGKSLNGRREAYKRLLLLTNEGEISETESDITKQFIDLISTNEKLKRIGLNICGGKTLAKNQYKLKRKYAYVRGNIMNKTGTEVAKELDVSERTAETWIATPIMYGEASIAELVEDGQRWTAAMVSDSSRKYFKSDDINDKFKYASIADKGASALNKLTPKSVDLTIRQISVGETTKILEDSTYESHKIGIDLVKAKDKLTAMDDSNSGYS